MKITLKRWWIFAVLVMALGNISVDSLKDLGNEAIKLVRKDFHNTNKIKKAFHVFSTLTTVYREDSDGTFVKVKFTMKQTNCDRRKWMNPDCTPKVTAKKMFNCLGCFKFNSTGHLLKTGYQKCVRQSLAKMKEVTKERRKACAKLRDKKDKRQIYDVGVYSFQSAPLGQYEN